MFKIESWFTDVASPPDHVVACAFEADLPFAEHGVLDRLHRAGAGHLTVLVGAQDYLQSFVDLAATRHAGVFYSFHRVRLPGYLAAFHAKLYLLLWTDSARLLVSSANLTRTGFRSNLEVADELTLKTGEPSDRAAFIEYASFLEALGRIDPSLSASVFGRLGEAAQRVREIASRCLQRDDAAVFIHTADRALLPQLRSVVGEGAVDRITIVSPFFDGRSAGILALVRAFSTPNKTPKVRIIKDGSATGDLDGSALGQLGRSVVVERLRGLESESGHRALHAKLVILESARRAWVVAGSANATSAAWAKPAFEGGNLEAVTVRAMPSSAARRLVDALVTEVLPHSDLQREILEDENRQITYSCSLQSATLTGDIIELRCSAGQWALSDGDLQVRLTSREGSAVLPVVIHSRTATEVLLRTTRSDDLFYSGVAVVVEVQSKTHLDARSISNAAWVDKPLYQDMPPSLRAGFRALSQLGDRAFVDTADPLHDAAQFLANLTLRLAADLANTPPDESRPVTPVSESPATSGGSFDDQADESDAESLDDATDSTATLAGGATLRKMEGGHVGAHLQMAQRLFDGVVAASLRDLEDDDRYENAAAKRAVSRLGRHNTNASSDESMQQPPTGVSNTGRKLLQDGLSSLQQAVTRVLRLHWTAEHVPQLTAAVDSLLAAQLRFAQHLEAWDEGLQTAAIVLLQDTWNRVWSVDGYLLGQCRGLYARASTDSTIGPALRTVYGDPDRLARVVAMLAMTAVLRRNGNTSKLAISDGIRQGFLMVLGETPLKIAGVRERFHQYWSAFQTNVTNVELDLVADALIVPRLDSTADGALLKAWLPIIRIEEARPRYPAGWMPNDPGLLDNVPRKILSRYEKVVRGNRNIGSIVLIPSGLACSHCRNSLPSEWRSNISRPDFAPICESCGTLLVPIAWELPEVSHTLDRMETLLVEGSSA